MPHLTTAQWRAQLDACGSDMTQEQLLNVVFRDGPNAVYTGIVNDLHVSRVKGFYEYLSNFFPVRVWKDWNGVREIGKKYYSPYLPFDMGIFQRSMQICDPSNLNECHTDYCEIPVGGIEGMPELEMYKAGFKTQRICIANIRTSQQALEIAQRIVNERFGIDQQVMEIFYTLATIRMLGHKWILEYTQDEDGLLIPRENNNPYNILGGYDYNYMSPLFPQIGDINNIMPLDFKFLDSFGSALTLSGAMDNISTGPRGEPIWEMWHADDWYRQSVLDNPEYIEKARFFVDPKTLMLTGHTNDSQQREVVGNFAMKQMKNLPRFAQSSTGGLTVVQPYTNVAIDEGNRPLHNHREWNNAPILMSVILGKEVGEILSRPALTTGVEGKEIMPITGNGDWVYRNDYDKECNPDMNMPYFQKRYEMGFQLKNPDAGRGFLSRARKFRQRPVNTCDLQPIITVTPAASDCTILTIGCNPLNDRLSNNIIEDGGARKILCSSAMCGKDTIYRLSLQGQNLDSISPGLNPLNCSCGDDVIVFINDEDGELVSQQTATLIDFMRPNVTTPHAIWFVELEEALEDGECISAIACVDATPTVANVIGCVDNETDPTLGATKLRVTLDSSPTCGLGDTATLTYYNAAGSSLGTKSVTISDLNPDTLVYILTSSGTFECDAYPNIARITLTCA